MRFALLLPLALTALVADRSAAVDPDIRVVLNIEGVTPGPNWFDSYSVGNNCYCDQATTYDHGIGTFNVETPLGWMTVREVCEMLGPGPGSAGRPVYNDVQCGNGPPNDAGDEHTCPGRVDIGIEGCGHIGPKWNFEQPGETFLKVTFGSGAIDGYERPNPLNIIGDPISFGGGGLGIGGTQASIAYASHMWSFDDFGYKALVDPSKTYMVKIGLAESYSGACLEGGRVFDLIVGENKSLSQIDTYKLAGNQCAYAHDIYFRNVVPNSSGELIIMARKGLFENPFLGVVEISYEDASYVPETPAPTPQPTPFSTPIPDDTPDTLPLKINFGTDAFVDGFTGPLEGKMIGSNIQGFFQPQDITGTSDDDAYASHVWSPDGVVGYKLRVDPSKTYRVKVGLAEAYGGNCAEGYRRFNVRAGNKSRDGIDVFTEAGCRSALDIFFTDVSPSQSGDLRIEALVGDADNPMISIIEVSEEHTLGGEYRSLPLKISFGSNEPVDGYDVVDESRLSGVTNPSAGRGESISSTVDDAAYRSNLWSTTKIAYAIDKVDPSRTYTVRLGFAETYLTNCERGRRLFDVQVATSLKRDVDVYAGASDRCLAAYDLFFYGVEPIDGLIPIIVRKGSVDNPFVSVLEITAE